MSGRLFYPQVDYRVLRKASASSSETCVSGRLLCPPNELTLIKMKKRNFFSEEFFTIKKEIFPYCQGIIFFTPPLGDNLPEGKSSL
jgi:hypothetical protein